MTDLNKDRIQKLCHAAIVPLGIAAALISATAVQSASADYSSVPKQQFKNRESISNFKYQKENQHDHRKDERP